MIHDLSRTFCTVLLCCLCGVCTSRICMAQTDAYGNIRFEETIDKSGIDFVHTDGGTGQHYLYETVTGGLSTFDFDNDGSIDICFTTGILPQNPEQSTPVKLLFRNRGAGQFVDVSQQSGLDVPAYSLGSVVGDFDNDGFDDLYLNCFGFNLFFVNNGDGTFARKLDDPSVSFSHLGAGAVFLDIEGDGDLDLWVGSYVKFDYEKKVSRMVFGVPAAPGPKDFPPASDRLFRNNGDGTFTDVSQQAGVSAVAGTSMGMVSLDFDSDGDVDVFVCNDGMENFLWQNDGTGHFDEVAQLLGVAYDLLGATQANMGVDCADIDGDGWLDLVATNFDAETPNVYCNVQGKYFDDLSAKWGLGIASRDVKWGVAIGDFDLDSWPDLFIATGHLFEGVTEVGSSQKFASLNRLFRNYQGKRFSEVLTDAAGPLKVHHVSRGVCAEDFDNDGDLDLLIVHLNAKPSLLQNQTPRNDTQWLKVQLIGTNSNRNAAGTLVTVQTKDRLQRQVVCCGRGYQSHFGSLLQFGIPPDQWPCNIEIRWPNGQTQSLTCQTGATELKIVQP